MRFSAFKTVFQYVSLIGLALALISCGGSDEGPGGELTAPTARLMSFDIATPMGESIDIDFDPSRFGVYSFEVPSDTSSLSFTAQAQADFTLRYELGVDFSDPRFVAPPLDSPVRSTAFESGVAQTIDLSVGENQNLLRVSVIGQNSDVVAQYSFSIRRLSAQAELTQLNVFVGTNAQVLTPEFSADVLNYTLEVPATSCAVAMSTRASSNATNISINGEVNQFGAIQTILTPVGETSVDVILNSEDGTSSNTYNVVLTRPEPSDEERRTLNTLSALSIEGAQFDFDCTTTSVAVTIGGNTQGDSDTPFTTPLSFTPASLDSSVSLIEQEVNTTTGEILNSEVIPLTNTEVVDLALALGLNFYQLRVTPEQGPSLSYSIVIESVERTITTVSTPAAFQQALLDAQPNEEIRLEQGVFTADASTSGIDSAYFYTSQSGMPEAPIFISGELNGDGATLTGDGADSRAVLQIDGDNWVIANLNIAGAQTGIRLNGTDNVIVEGVNFDNTLNNGVVIENASHNNNVVQSNFNTQGTAIVVGSDSSTWRPELGGQGTLEADNNQNVVRGNIFTHAIDMPSVEVNEGAQDTIVEFNRFTPAANSEANTGSAIAVQGNDTVIRYNFVDRASNEATPAIIRVSPATVDNLAVQYGQNTQVYANQIKQTSSRVFVQADAGLSVLADGNTRVDGMALTFSGDAANTTEFNAPYFSLKPSIDQAQCVALNTETLIANTQLCAEQDNQDWRIVLNSEGFLVFLNRIDLERALSLSSTIDANRPFGVLAAPVNIGSRLQIWVPDFDLTGIRFLSREAVQFGFVTVDQGNGLVFAASDVNNFLSAPNFILDFE